MSDDINNKVTVKIHGQEYTITGEKSRDHIIKVADHVDAIISEIADSGFTGSGSMLATLAAVNVTDELFSERVNNAELITESDQLEKDKEHYIQLWEEAKKSFLQYKEDAQAAVDQKDLLQEKYNKCNMDLEEIKQENRENLDKIRTLEEKIENLNLKLKNQAEGNSTSSETIKQLEEQYKEIEGNYFELQMENIQLKGDLERYKKIVE